MPELPGNEGLRALKGCRLVALIVVLLGIFAQMTAQAPAHANSQPKVHTYYIAADDVQWNYLPSLSTFVLRGENEIAPTPAAKSNTYRKAVYREYTNDTFTTLKPRPPEWEHLGILGPLIRAEVGDVKKKK